jgi:nitrate/nitrite transporter NarK
MHITGVMTGWFLVGGGLGGMLMPWLIGQAFANIGPGSMVTIVLASLVFNIAALFAFTKVVVKPAGGV